MTDYLIRLGHRKIAVLAAEKEDVSIGRMRLMGYWRALREQGIEPDDNQRRRPSRSISER